MADPTTALAAIESSARRSTVARIPFGQIEIGTTERESGRAGHFSVTTCRPKTSPDLLSRKPVGSTLALCLSDFKPKGQDHVFGHRFAGLVGPIRRKMFQALFQNLCCAIFAAEPAKIESLISNGLWKRSR